ncbi:MAG: tetratricopeptide repeat protein [Bacteroidetes bacterium]|nr:tetratricopeptide repeat protein [Bacteroidota bacterium]
MSTKINKETSWPIDEVLPSNHARCFLFLFFYWISQTPLSAQVNQSDSLQIAKIISQSHERLIQHNYQEAAGIAQKGLDKSTKLNFKWGLINSLLVIAQAQKSLSNYPASLNYYLQALSEIQKQNDKKTLAWVNLKIGELFQEWGVPEKALPYYNTVLALQSEKSGESYSQLIEHIADAHLSLSQKEQSMKMYLELLDIRRKKSDIVQTKKILEKIASIYSMSNDAENSLKYRLQILEINKQLKDTVQIASALSVIGKHYIDLKNLDKALESYQAALAMNRQINRKGLNDNNVVTNLINIGTIFQSRGDTRNSIKYFNDALQIKEKKGTPIEVAVMHNYLASLYLAQANYPEAEDQTKEAISLLSGTDNKRVLATSYKRLSDIYMKQGSYEKSLTSYQTYSMLKDSLLYREQLAQEQEKLKEYAIETAEKEAKLSLIDHEMQALELRNEKEIAEREKQKIALLLKEKELQNVFLQKEQSEQARAVQQLQLQQGKVEKERQAQEILLLEQKRDLQNAEIQKKELQEKERQKEIDYKNTKLALQQSQLERVGIRQQYLTFISVLFFALILLTLLAYLIKRRDNQKLQTQYHEINNQKEQIESINKTLVELNEEKNDLIGIVAHDLKSPLNQISGMLEIIKLTTKDQPEEQQSYTSQMEKAANRLKNMVTKILDVSAIESKALNITLERINITEALDEIVNRFGDIAAKKNISIKKEFESGIPSIESDMGYVSEVLENLMSNAVKYSPLGKQVTIKLSQQGGFVRIEFIDQGQGINQKDMKNLFGKYHKLTARPTAGEDSTGLGLSIVKKYILALNGRVWCESEEGKGSDFIVELPVPSTI